MFLSVIIPTRNRAILLEKALDSLTKQDYPFDHFEVIVVDNGSTDNTKDVCSSFDHKFFRLNYLFDDRPGLHVGRHLGMRHSKGDVLVYADDDICAFPSWLSGVSKGFLSIDALIVGGPCLPNYESPPPSFISFLWSDTPYGKINPSFSLLDGGDEIQEISPRYVFGCNFSIRRDALVRVGGFHPDGMPKEFLHLRGDGETAVSDAVSRMGGKAIYHPEAGVYHFVSKKRMTLSYIYNRSFNGGISDSYAAVRQQGGFSIRKLLIFFFLNLLSTLRKCVRMRAVGLMLGLGYGMGFFWHQLMVRRDPLLLKWVNKENYWEDTP